MVAHPRVLGPILTRIEAPTEQRPTCRGHLALRMYCCHPPLTGGMKAISSPSLRGVSGGTNSRLTEIIVLFA